VCIDDAPEGSVELMDGLFTCLGERCSGLGAEDFASCQGEQCYGELLACAADSDPDSCWGLEACIIQDCGQDAPQDCYDGCLEGASAPCQDCLADADSAFVRDHCAQQVLTFERCTELHECLEYACAEEHCRRELDGIRGCRDDALGSAADDYRGRVEPCYPPPE